MLAIRSSEQGHGRTVRVWHGSLHRQDEQEGCSHPHDGGLCVRWLWCFGWLWSVVCFALFWFGFFPSNGLQVIQTHCCCCQQEYAKPNRTPKKHAAVQAVQGCRECQSLVLVPEDSAHNICEVMTKAQTQTGKESETFIQRNKLALYTSSRPSSSLYGIFH